MKNRQTDSGDFFIPVHIDSSHSHNYTLDECDLEYDNDDGNKDGCMFSGRMAHGHLLQGNVVFNDGRVYTGQFNEKNNPDGIGSIRYPSGAIFSGTWKNGDMIYGIWIYPDGHTQIANYNFHDGYFEGGEYFPNGTWNDGFYQSEDNQLIFGDVIRSGAEESEHVDVYGIGKKDDE